MMKKSARVLCLAISFFIAISQVQAAKIEGKKQRPKSKLTKEKVIAKKKYDKVVFSDPAKTILVSRSSPVFSITLQSNRTTGYSWALKNYDSELITPIRSRFYPPKDKKLLGAPGYEKWTFRVKPKAFAVPHITNISLVYVRPTDGQSAKVVNFRVVTK